MSKYKLKDNLVKVESAIFLDRIDLTDKTNAINLAKELTKDAKSNKRKVMMHLAFEIVEYAKVHNTRKIKIILTDNDLSVKVRIGKVKDDVYRFLNRIKNLSSEITELRLNDATQLVVAELYSVENECELEYYLEDDSGLKSLDMEEAHMKLNQEFIDITEKMYK